MVSSEAQNVKILMMSSLSISFLFVAYAFDVISKKLLIGLFFFTYWFLKFFA